EHEGTDRIVREMDQYWKSAVEEAARLEGIVGPLERTEAAGNVLGVIRVSYWEEGKMHHRELSQSEEEIPNSILNHSIDKPPPETPGWSTENGTLRYVASAGSARSVILTTDLKKARDIVSEKLRTQLSNERRPVPSGALRTLRHESDGIIAMGGNSNLSEEDPDEIFPIYSIFGEWTIDYWRPRLVVESRQLDLLIGGLTLGIIIAAGGWWLSQKQEKARRLLEQRVSFVNAVSHELRTPLTNILLAAEVMEEEIEQERPRERLRILLDEGRRLSRMVENVLTFSGMEQGKLQPSSQIEIPLRSFLKSCLSPFDLSFKRKKISCELLVPESLNLVAEEDLLSQIIMNLLSNIEKYAGQGSRSWIRAWQDKDTFVEVGDEGPGIPQDAHRRIFRSFERVDHRVTAGISGAGLGLSISRELARKMGGDLILTPEKKGAVFQLRIPKNQKS
ncbi:HAMP domain-containing histidine kinase, partial [Akkermansiaceae bacterium]|nr:HAMP domain-containing histidine kinase [Akkermansiaceae bacterium]